MVKEKESATTGEKDNAALNSDRGRQLRDDELDRKSVV